MKLNIETTDKATILRVLKQVFTNEEVSIVAEYDKTVDYEVKPKGADERCEYVYSAESIIELSKYIEPYIVRIY